MGGSNLYLFKFESTSPHANPWESPGFFLKQGEPCWLRTRHHRGIVILCKVMTRSIDALRDEELNTSSNGKPERKRGGGLPVPF